MGNENFHITYGDKEVSFFLPNPTDHIQKQILNTKNFYEIDVLEEIGRFPLNEGIICDIGANIGNHTLYFSKILDREVFAFEPIKEARNILQHNLDLNGVEDKVCVYPFALGAENTKGVMDINLSNLGASRLHISPDGDVEIRTLDEVLDKNISVALLKIDVEGFEVEVLKGAKNTILKHHPLIIAEAQTHQDFLYISHILNDYGYHPIGQKGATATVFFIPSVLWKRLSQTPLPTYLLRKDIDISRRLIQGQGDRLSRTVENIFKTVKDTNDKVGQTEQQFNASNHQIQESLLAVQSTIVDTVEGSASATGERLSSLEMVLKDDIKEVNASNHQIQESLLAVQSTIVDTVEGSASATGERLSSLEMVVKNELEKYIAFLSDIKGLINHPAYRIGDKKNELAKGLKATQDYILLLQRMNDRLLKKVEVIYSSNTWRYTSFFRKMLSPGSKIQTFEVFKNKLISQIGDSEKRRENFLTSTSQLKNNINYILQVQESITNVIDEVPYQTIIESKSMEKTDIRNRFGKLKGKTESNKIFIGVAAIPSRRDALEKTIASLIDQADQIGVYLNGWDKIPQYLKHEKILIVRSQENGDIGDAGKFFWVDGHSGYYFTCDDDIIYPSDYVIRILAKIKEYKFKAVIGWHGSVIIHPFEDYYTKESRRVFAFGSNRPEDTFVHILGTGTVGFHTSTIKAQLADFIKPNMADVFFAELGQKQKVPFIVMKHGAGEMVSIDEVQEDSINKHAINNVDSKKNTKLFQNDLVKKINWRLFNSLSMKIIMIGRFDTFSKGGIYKSNHLIKSALEELGHSVVSCDSQAEGFLPPKGVDAAIIYPGDPNRPDFEHADKKIKSIRESGIPVLVNLSYNTKKERSSEIVDRILQYNSDKELPPVYLMTFTDVALSDSALSQIADFIVPMPKTISGHYGLLSLPEFDEREGIVLGDAAKLCNLDITGVDIRPYIAECKKLLPHVKLYAFKQYGGSENIPGIEAVPYMKEGFLDWVAGRRLFVCLNTITTFEMTPTEAQFVGTPVVYRPMPQSLSEYVGRSGICVTSPQEFAQMCAWLYNDKFAWNSYSKLALSNSATNDEESLRIGIETSLRRVVFKSKAQK